MIRLLFSSSLYWPDIGGIEVFGKELLRGLRDRHGFEVHAVCGVRDAADAGLDVVDGVPVRRVSMAGLRLDAPASWLRVVHEIRSLIRVFRPDFVQLSGVMPMEWFVRKAARDEAIRVVFVDHGGPRPGRFDFARAIVRGAEQLVAVSPAALPFALLLDPTLAKRYVVIPNGLPAPLLAPAPLPTPPRLVCIGRLEPEKGFDLAIRALAALAPRLPGVHLELLGEGTAEASLRSLAVSLGVKDHVTFAGRCDRAAVYRSINQASMLLAPSRRHRGFCEAFCLSALEAAQLGRPAIVSDIDGLPETVLDRETGLVIPEDDVDALAGAIALLAADPALASRLGRAARTRAASDFSFGRMVDAYAGLYRRMAIAGRGTRDGELSGDAW
jgi:glycogen(starch) synthase